MPAYAIYVDPGFGGTGWIAVERGMANDTTLRQPVGYGCITVTKPKEWHLRAERISNEFSDVLMKYRGAYIDVYIEMPQYMEGNAQATTKGSGKKGDDASAIFKLQFLVGCLARTVWDFDSRFHPVGVTWKRQLSKSAVIARIYKRLGKGTEYPNHIADAVGLYLFVMGKLDVSSSEKTYEDLSSPLLKDIPTREDGVGMEELQSLPPRIRNIKKGTLGQHPTPEGHTTPSLERKGKGPRVRIRKHTSG